MAEETRCSMSATEAWACYLLATDGWSVGELAMTFQCGQGAVRRSIKRYQPEFFNEDS